MNNEENLANRAEKWYTIGEETCMILLMRQLKKKIRICSISFIGSRVQEKKQKVYSRKLT